MVSHAKQAGDVTTFDNNSVQEGIDANHDAVAFAQKKKEKDAQDSKHSDTFEEFSASTTLHGLRFIGDHASVLPRRCLWLLLVLLCGTLFAHQVVDRILYYLDSPITVNFKVNYNRSVPFPAVTICNQNMFRVSQAYKSNWLRFIEAMYEDDLDRMELLSSKNTDTEKGPVTVLFDELAHTREDFIVRCFWANEECSAANFTVTLTAHGVCYTFNKVAYPHQALHVQHSGVEHALRLTLNTEQYENMAGPHTTTGIKMLASDQSEIPSVTEVGLAISSGTHAFVGLGVITINNLPPPHGECGESTLLSTERYTQESCMLECKTNYAVKTCGCRHFYMPNLDNKTGVCTVAEYITCMQDAIKSFNDVSDHLCKCPTPCFYNIYEPSVSYATSSNMKASLKEAVNESDYRDRYYAAKEIRNKIDEEIRLKFSETIRELNRGLKNLAAIIYREFRQYISQHIRVLNKLDQETTNTIQKQAMTLEFQKFVVEKNFIRGRDAMEEKALGVVCLGFNEFVNDIENKLSYLIENNLDSTETSILRMLVKSSLKNKMDTLIRTKTNYTQLVHAYQSGEFIFNATYRDYDWEDHVAVVPRILFNESFTDTDMADNSYLQMDDINAMITAIENYENYVNGTDEFEEPVVKNLSYEFCLACENYLDKKSLFFSEVIDRPVRILNKRIEVLHGLKKDYKTIEKDLANNLVFLNEAQEKALKYALPELEDAFDFAMKYVTNRFGDHITKYTVAKKISNTRIVNDVSKVDNFIQDFDSRGEEIFESWTTLERKILEIWKTITEDEDSVEYSRHRKYVRFLEPYWRRSAEVTKDVRLARNNFDTRGLKKRVDNTLLPKVKEMIEELTEYKNGHVLDEEFYKNNFLQMDVYFKELRSEQIDQQIAYDEFALLCDIGGSMGLLIGGSVLTFFEIIDCLIVCALSRIMNKQN